jgi:hypothetical protein
VSDAPRIIRLDDGSLHVNQPAAKALDDELKRLQGVERVHSAESWVQVVAVSLLMGLLIGAGVGFATGYAAGKSSGGQ